jgi:hypothetical protein
MSVNAEQNVVDLRPVGGRTQALIEFVPYQPWHYHELRVQAAQLEWQDTILSTPGYAEALDVPGMSFTGISDGQIVGCAGLQPQWHGAPWGRVVAWGLFSDTIPKRAWVRIARKMASVIVSSLDHGPHRLEMTTPCNFFEAGRLALVLGFAIEGRLLRFGPDGADHFMWSRIVGERECVH